MRLCRVLGNVVSTVKHPVYHRQTLLVVQPIDETGADLGASFLAIDRVQAGPGDRVLVMSEGNGVRQIMQLGEQVPIRSLVVGVVDQVDVPAASAAKASAAAGAGAGAGAGVGAGASPAAAAKR